MTSEVALAVAQIFGVFFIGWLARHLRYIDEPDVKRWSNVVVDFLFPLLAFHSIITGFKAERVGQLWPLPVLGLGIIVVGVVCGRLLRFAIRSKDPNVVRTFYHLCAINNYAFLPLIIVANLWGDVGVANLFVFNLGSTIGYWTIGVGVLGGANIRSTARNILSSNLVAVVLALALCLCGWQQHVPKIVLNITDLAGSATIPCMLVLIGASLYPLPSLRNVWDVLTTSVIRLLLLPAVLIAILALIPLDPAVRNIAVIVALMPATISSPIITRRYGGSPDFAARVAVLTTLLSIITVPLAVLLLRGMLTFGG